jgi:hypothetical protein
MCKKTQTNIAICNGKPLAIGALLSRSTRFGIQFTVVWNVRRIRSNKNNTPRKSWKKSLCRGISSREHQIVAPWIFSEISQKIAFTPKAMIATAKHPENKQGVTEVFLGYK